ncbi:SRPBCC family protein [Nocardioides sp. R-C-SC26]|uniref:SRPBCC family protein n=1 Tax=Nocardioides sp. R-C-SC26 TaxID=2870414 RepID=UPI001E45775E|nr:SRPBCC family protein [Nocardioides sp. R-C-SC26]
MATMYPCERVELDWLDRAPARFSNTVSLAITPAQAWEVLERADTWPRWASVITDVEYTSPQPFGVGTTRVVTMRGGIIGDEEFLAWDPGAHMAFRFNSSSVKQLGAFLEDYRIVATPSGCDLTWSLGQSLSGASKVMLPVSRPITDLMFRRFLRNLRRLTADGVPPAL